MLFKIGTGGDIEKWFEQQSGVQDGAHDWEHGFGQARVQL